MAREFPGEIITLRCAEGYQAQVSKYAAHLLSWTNPAGKEALFVSDKAVFAPPKAIRGGVPVCFPQFGPLGPLQQAHGFVRNSAEWEVSGGSGRNEDAAGVEPPPTSVTLVLRYHGSDPAYPHPFELRNTVALLPGGRLEQSLEAINTGPEVMPFTCALHTYYGVADVSTVQVRGLGHFPYEDSLEGRKLKEVALMPDAPVFIDREVDRIYKTGQDVAVFEVEDPGNERVIRIQTEGFPDAVLWNPWIEKSKSLSDFDDLEYRKMVCLEPAIAASGPVKLDPGSSWFGKQSITVCPSRAGMVLAPA